jgi:hypothetical protein
MLYIDRGVLLLKVYTLCRKLKITWKYRTTEVHSHKLRRSPTKKNKKEQKKGEEIGEREREKGGGREQQRWPQLFFNLILIGNFISHS